MDFNISIEPFETIDDYKLRLSKNKDEYGLSWRDIAKLINEIAESECTDDACRKWYARHRIDEVKDSSLDEQEIAIEKAKMKFYDQRREYKKLLRNDARQENIVDIIKSAVKTIEPVSLDIKAESKEDSGVDLFVGLNDIHYGAFINNYWNNYNPDIAKERLGKYLSEIIKIKETHNAENCYVCANGDLISGKIHNTIEISNCENVVSQVMNVSELISQFLFELCCHFNKVFFCVVSGNHSRMGKKNESPKGERLDDLIPWYVEVKMSNIPNFSIIHNEIDPTVNLANIRGLNYLNVHGDYDGFSTIQKLTGMINEDIYCIHFGHLHHNFMEWNQRYKIIMSGSLQGMDDFCVEKRIFGKAQQLVGVCSKDGMICAYDIDLQ